MKVKDEEKGNCIENLYCKFYKQMCDNCRDDCDCCHLYNCVMCQNSIQINNKWNGGNY